MYNRNNNNNSNAYDSNNNHHKNNYWNLQNLPRGAPTLRNRTWTHSALAMHLLGSVGANTHKGRLLHIMAGMYHDYFNNGNFTIDSIQNNGRLPRNYVPPSTAPKSFKQLFQRSRHAPIKQSEIERAMQDVVAYVAHAPATSIQTAFRGYAARKKLSSAKNAATKIQTAFRAHAARKKYANMLHRHYMPGGAGAQQALERMANGTYSMIRTRR